MSDQVECLQVSPECPVEASVYGFYPSLGANSFFLAFFALFFFLNLGLGAYFKTWTYMIFMCLACITETIGYVGRIIMHHNPWDNNGFIMQICCLIIGPAFNSGAIYLTLKYITLTFGSKWSRVRPNLYTWIFVGGDLVALILQAVGGAMASTANDDQQLKIGDNVAMAGISWQVFTLAAFAVTSIDYIVRRTRSTAPLLTSALSTFNDGKFRVFAAAISFAWLTVFTRCVYRIIEFAGGWGNSIMRDQTSFIVLEGVMIVLATFCQTVFHPGYSFPALSSRQKSLLSEDEPKVMTDSSREQSVERKRGAEASLD